MNWRTRLWGAGLAAALALQPSVRAQESSAPSKHYYNKSSFRIPIVITEQQVADLSALKLFVRQNGGEWTCVATAPPTQKTFTYQAPGDGEYWFSIATVDKAGATSPDDMKGHDPALVVVVDTQPPNVDLQPVIGNSGKTYLKCNLNDPNPDYQSLQIQYQSADGQWHSLEGLANSTGYMQVPDPKVLSGRLHIHAADLAGNVTDRDMDADPSRVAQLSQSSRPAPSPYDSAPATPLPSAVDPVVPPLPPAIAKSIDSLPPAADGEPLVPPLPAKSESMPQPTPPTLTADGARPLPVGLTPSEVDGLSQPQVLPPLARSVNSTDGSRQPASTDLPRPVGLPERPRPALAIEPSRPALAIESSRPIYPTEVNRQLLPAQDSQFGVPGMPIINSTRCRLEFALEPLAGGIAEVEVWATIDGGRTWKVVGGSRDGQSPALVEFPGEGRYGYAFVVKPVSGLPSSLPRAGEPLDGWIEIDTTRPAAELSSVVPGIGPDSGSLVITWTAKDANLGAEPIRLSYATQPGGPWMPIVDRTANTGSMRWPLPRDIGPRVWIRMEVRDRAGNLTGCETPQPIPLEGPRARVRVLNVAPLQN